MRTFKRPRDIFYGLGGLALFVWMVADGFHQPSIGLFTVWTCGGALLLEALDRRSNRRSSRR